MFPFCFCNQWVWVVSNRMTELKAPVENTSSYLFTKVMHQLNDNFNIDFQHIRMTVWTSAFIVIGTMNRVLLALYSKRNDYQVEGFSVFI